MKFTTRSGNTYLYDRYSNMISLATPGKEKPLESLTFEPVPAANRLRNLSTFIIEFTRDCNLRCRYCCYSGSYSQHRAHGNDAVISLNRIQEIADVIDLHRVADRQLYISIYGGEPFTHKSLLKEAVEYLLSRFPGVEITISTNLVNFTEDDARWCIEKDIALNVSFDGCREVHDRSRININQSGTFDAVVKHLYMLFNIKHQYFDARVNLLMVLASVDDLLPNAKFWGEEPLLKTKEPYLIAGISPTTPIKTIVDKVHIISKLYELLDYYACNRDNKYCRAYFRQLTSIIFDREIYNLDFNPSGLVCLPDNKRCFIDLDGNLGICEKCGDNLRIGTLTTGFDIDKVNLLVQEFTQVRQRRCAECEIARLCQKCFSSSHFSDADWEADCKNNVIWTEISMLMAVELSELKMMPTEDAEKCHLAPLTEENYAETLRIMGNPRVIEYIRDFSTLKNLSDAKKFITLLRTTYDFKCPGVLGIFNDNERLIGYVGIDQIDFMEPGKTDINENRHNANMFFALDEEYWNRGIMTEMLSQYLSSYINTASQTLRLNIYLDIIEDNKAALKLASKFQTLQIIKS